MADNPADLFLRLWLQLESSLDIAEVVRKQESHPNVDTGIRETLVGLLGADGDVDRLGRWLENSRLPATEAALLAAQAVDRWYRPLTTNADIHIPLSPALKRARAAFGRRHAFNSDISLGQVIPSRPRWGRWQDPDFGSILTVPSLMSLFDGLTCLPATITASNPDDRDQPRPIRLHYRFQQANQRPAPVGPLVVGLAPVAEAEDDIRIHLRDEDGKRWYDTDPAEALGERAAQAIEKLCREGAHIIVFPEMVFSTASLQKVAAAIAAHGPDSALHFVLAGTHRNPNGGGRPYNEAVMFNHLGQSVLQQAKLHRWNMDRSACQRYGFVGENILHEYITPGDAVTVLEFPQFGRLLVMVCEDLGRSEPGAWLRSNVMLDWIFTPILDSSIEDWRWMCEKGRDAAAQGKCRVIVSNSLALTLLRNRVCGAKTDQAGIGACIDVDVDAGLRGKVVMDDPTQASPRRQSLSWSPAGWTAYLSDD